MQPINCPYRNLSSCDVKDMTITDTSEQTQINAVSVSQRMSLLRVCSFIADPSSTPHMNVVILCQVQEFVYHAYPICNRTSLLHYCISCQRIVGWGRTDGFEGAYISCSERVLFARVFPAAYIIRLYPKKSGGHAWASSTLQSGLPGNIFTYLSIDSIPKI